MLSNRTFGGFGTTAVDAEVQVFYEDIQGGTQGPFPAKRILDWYRQGYFKPSTKFWCGTENGEKRSAPIPLSELAVHNKDNPFAVLEVKTPSSEAIIRLCADLERQRQKHADEMADLKKELATLKNARIETKTAVDAARQEAFLENKKLVGQNAVLWERIAQLEQQMAGMKRQLTPTQVLEKVEADMEVEREKFKVVFVQGCETIDKRVESLEKKTATVVHGLLTRLDDLEVRTKTLEEADDNGSGGSWKSATEHRKRSAESLVNDTLKQSVSNVPKPPPTIPVLRPGNEPYVPLETVLLTAQKLRAKLSVIPVTTIEGILAKKGLPSGVHAQCEFCDAKLQQPLSFIQHALNKAHITKLYEQKYGVNKNDLKFFDWINSA